MDELKRAEKNASRKIDDFDDEDVANAEEELAKLEQGREMKAFFEDMGREKGPIDPVSFQITRKHLKWSFLADGFPGGKNGPSGVVGQGG